jgi:hypothetical protein
MPHKLEAAWHPVIWENKRENMKKEKCALNSVSGPGEPIFRISWPHCSVVFVRVHWNNCFIPYSCFIPLSFLFLPPPSISKSKLLYDCKSVSQSWCWAHSGTCDQILFPVGRLLSESCSLVSVGRPLWWEDGSAVCNAITHWSESRRTRNRILLSYLRLLHPGGPGSRIYEVYPPGTGWHCVTPLSWTHNLILSSCHLGNIAVVNPRKVYLPLEIGNTMVCTNFCLFTFFPFFCK